MTNFSPNMLKTFQSCPQKYWYKYIQKISTPQKSSMFEKGKKIHALAHYYLRGDDITKLQKALSSEEYQDWESLKQNEFFQKSYVNSEYNLSCRIGDYWIGGRLDALVKDENFYYILDYKTGQIPKNPEYDFQTMVYLLCVSKKINPPLTPPLKMEGNAHDIKFVYIDLKNNENCIINYKNDYENRIIEICQQIENIQLSEAVEYTKKCEFCEYRKLCFFTP